MKFLMGGMNCKQEGKTPLKTNQCKTTNSFTKVGDITSTN